MMTGSPSAIFPDPFLSEREPFLGFEKGWGCADCLRLQSEFLQHTTDCPPSTPEISFCELLYYFRSRSGRILFVNPSNRLESVLAPACKGTASFRCRGPDVRVKAAQGIYAGVLPAWFSSTDYEEQMKKKRRGL